MKRILYLLLALFIVSCSDPNPQSLPDWSIEAVQKANDVIPKWESEGLMKLDQDKNKIEINPILWKAANAEQKREMIMCAIVYWENSSMKHVPSVEVFDKQSGKQIAKYEKGSEIDLEF